MVGPDRLNKSDNHSNAAFATEGREMRAWFAKHLPDNFFVICGDRHWQYHSIDPATGVHEFSTGSSSDAHSAGTPGFNKLYHQHHRVKGGFLSVTANAGGITFRHHNEAGQPVYEYSR
jgi:alkaline phosphatase D